jgi:alpha-N-arabinofuranosidase
VVHVSLCNLDPGQEAPVDIEIKGVKVVSVSGRVLTAEAMNAHNTFADPDAIFPVPFDAVRIEGGRVSAVLPSKSVVVLKIKQK